MSQESQTIGGYGRSDHFEYAQQFAGAGDIRSRVLMEVGAASGREPTQVVPLRSYVGQYLQEAGLSLGAEDEGPFPMLLLHFRRTFVEKLFAIHAKVEAFKTFGTPIGSYARHYYDLACLAQRPEVLAMLQASEYAQIRSDYDRVSTAHFPKSYLPPQGLSFAVSEALFPPDKLKERLGAEYEAQCRVLCFGEFPSWEEVLERFQRVRNLL